KKEFAPSLDKALFPGLQGGPLVHIIAAKAVCFKEAATSEFKNYCKEVLRNAKVLAEMLKKEGFRLTSDGTDNHLLNIDFGADGPSGKEVEEALEEVGIIVNREVVPFDTRRPFIASGIRVGTPAVTTRGMKEKEMETIAFWLSRLIKNLNNKKISEEISKRVKILTKKFPVA
ncbi:serine hydroxymethyltransferase, partial [Candidatus Curtissbacteria bacterium]|nr:serine hydroxymethyltransferase [Candidatus Curtissbacteria bacterium]